MLPINQYNKFLFEALWTYRKRFDNNRSLHVTNNKLYKFLVGRYILAFFQIFKKIISGLRKNNEKLTNETEIIAFVNSDNTYKTLKFLEINSNVLFLKQWNRLRKINRNKNNNYDFNFKIPFSLILRSLVNFNRFRKEYWNQIIFYPELYFTYWFDTYDNILFFQKNSKVKKIVFANDHNVNCRLFHIAAKEMGLKTYYLQHASVSLNFPKLDFSTSFLFGEKDYEVYKKIGEIDGKVIMVGSPSFDLLFHIRKKLPRKISVIGISINLLDSKEKVNHLVNILIKRISFIKLVLRSHPRDNRIFINSNNNRVIQINGSNQSLEDYFKLIDVNISCESSIHLEALYTNIPSFYYRLSDIQIYDNYSFIKNRVIEEIKENEIKEKLSLIDDIGIVYHKAKYYINSIDEKYDGDVSNYVNAVINKDI